MIIDQNATQQLSIPLATYFPNINFNNITKIVILFGNDKYKVQKLWNNTNKLDNTMDYNRTNRSLIVLLNQEETKNWKYQIPIQIRIKNKDNTVLNSPIFYGYINPCLSDEEI